MEIKIKKIDTVKIRQKNPELVERIMQSIKNLKLWTDAQYEGDTSVRSSVYLSRMIKNPKTKGRFLSKFLFQCLDDDIMELQDILDPDRLEEFKEQNFPSAEETRAVFLNEE